MIEIEADTDDDLEDSFFAVLKEELKRIKEYNENCSVIEFKYMGYKCELIIESETRGLQ